jgi:hypothetical protein
MEREDDLVELTTRPNELDAGLVREVLRSGGIECSVRAASGVALGVFGASSFNPMTIMVRRDELENAQRLLTDQRAASVDIDWEDVDVGEPADDIARKIAEKDPLDDAQTPRAAKVTSTNTVIIVIAAAAALLIGARFGTGAMMATLALCVAAAAIYVIIRKP